MHVCVSRIRGGKVASLRIDDGDGRFNMFEMLGLTSSLVDLLVCSSRLSRTWSDMQEQMPPNGQRIVFCCFFVHFNRKTFGDGTDFALPHRALRLACYALIYTFCLSQMPTTCVF